MYIEYLPEDEKIQFHNRAHISAASQDTKNLHRSQ